MEAPTATSSQSLLDLEDCDLEKEFAGGEYTVCRQASLGKVLPEHDKFLQALFGSVRRDYPKSSYIVFPPSHEDPEMALIVPEQEDRQALRRRLLPSLLLDGALHGCALKKYPEGDLLLVATQHLAQDTPIAVDCGQLWSAATHNEHIQHDKMKGIYSVEIPMDLFDACLDKSEAKHQKGVLGKGQAFVLATDTCGNESRYIADAGWVRVARDTNAREPNVSVCPVLHLSEPPRLTMVYYVHQDVAAGEELQMDWRCWETIAENVLPVNALWCHLLHADLQNVQAGAGAMIDMDDMVHGKFQPRRFDNEIPKDLVEQSGSQEAMYLWRLIYEDPTENSPKRPRQEESISVDSLTAIGVDPKLDRTTRPEEDSQLSPATRQTLDEHSDHTEPIVQRWINEELAVDHMDRVEVREILDCQNPVKLFALPGEKVYGIFAKRDFEETDWVLFYGGILLDYEADTVEDKDSYLLEATMEDYPDMKLVVNGNRSVAGKINDPIGRGTLYREANVGTLMEFDNEAKNPLIIVHAEKKICQGEEILLEYGEEYWHISVKSIMKAQNDFIDYALHQLQVLSSSPPEAAITTRVIL
jgi:hypothetical protein